MNIFYKIKQQLAETKLADTIVNLRTLLAELQSKLIIPKDDSKLEGCTEEKLLHPYEPKALSAGWLCRIKYNREVLESDYRYVSRIIGTVSAILDTNGYSEDRIGDFVNTDIADDMIRDDILQLTPEDIGFYQMYACNPQLLLDVLVMRMVMDKTMIYKIDAELHTYNYRWIKEKNDIIYKPTEEQCKANPFTYDNELALGASLLDVFHPPLEVTNSTMVSPTNAR